MYGIFILRSPEGAFSQSSLVEIASVNLWKLLSNLLWKGSELAQSP